MGKVVVWGKFGDELYVVVIPDNKVEENSGRPPHNVAEDRKRNLQELDFVDGVYIDCLDNGLISIIKLKPDVFVFGHDQRTEWEEKLKNYFSSKGFFLEYVSLKVYNNGVHSSGGDGC